MKKICLVGTAPSSFRLAPFNNPDWDIWCCSPGTWAAQPPRIDQFFELHRWEPGQQWMSKEYCEFLMEFEGKVWTSESVDGMKNCNIVPVDKLVSKYGPYFFTSSLAWMLAMAIEEKPQKIALFGVDMAADTEYGYQRAGCQYFAMLARALGIEIGVPPESDLLRPSPLYGVCETSHAYIKLLQRQRELTDRHTKLQLELTEKDKEFTFLTGALDDLSWNIKTWTGNMDSLGTEYVEPPLVPILSKLVHTNVVPISYDEALKEAETGK